MRSSIGSMIALVTGVVGVMSACGGRDTGTGTGPEAGTGADSASTRATEPATASGELRGAPVALDRLIDGDSMELLIEGETVEIRLVGINAPELRTLDGKDSCNGTTARDFVRDLIDAGSSLEFIAGEEDRFGRMLGVLIVDGVAVSDSLVEAGLALALWSGDDQALSGSMADAAAAGVGVWGDGCGPPSATGLVLSEMHVNAEGDDRENLNDEWVTVTNDGNTPVRLDGWTIRDETTSNRFLIDGVELAPGASIRFHSGSGSTDNSAYYLGEKFPVWSNRGETALLIDPQGQVAAYAFSLP